MDEEAKKYWSQRILGRVVGRNKVKRYLFNRSDIPLDKCEGCKKFHELLPVGLNDEWLCHKCGMENPEVRKQKFEAIIKRREAKYDETRCQDGRANNRENTRNAIAAQKDSIHFHRIKKS